MKIRQPAVAGQFYPANKSELEKMLEQLLPHSQQKLSAISIISPHAGYIYSGATAGRIMASVSIPETVIILGPNHRGVGAVAALSPDDAWQTPLGQVSVEKRLGSLICKLIPAVQEDAYAHRNEHSLEVQVPFLQYLRPDLSIVPICLGFDDYTGAEYLGKGIAEAIKQFGEEVMILASSDMTHYESADEAKKKDIQALERVLALDPEGLVEVCHSKRITMCGVIPSAVMLVAARELGAKTAELVDYTTSGDVTGDYSQVVGYAGVVVR